MPDFLNTPYPLHTCCCPVTAHSSLPPGSTSTGDAIHVDPEADAEAGPILEEPPPKGGTSSATLALPLLVSQRLTARRSLEASE